MINKRIYNITLTGGLIIILCIFISHAVYNNFITGDMFCKNTITNDTTDLNESNSDKSIKYSDYSEQMSKSAGAKFVDNKIVETLDRARAVSLFLKICYAEVDVNAEMIPVLDASVFPQNVKCIERFLPSKENYDIFVNRIATYKKEVENYKDRILKKFPQALSSETTLEYVIDKGNSQKIILAFNSKSIKAEYCMNTEPMHVKIGINEGLITNYSELPSFGTSDGKIFVRYENGAIREISRRYEILGLRACENILLSKNGKIELGLRGWYEGELFLPYGYFEGNRENCCKELIRFIHVKEEDLNG